MLQAVTAALNTACWPQGDMLARISVVTAGSHAHLELGGGSVVC